jgi:hypothetical protein
MQIQNVLEVVMWTGLVMTRTMARAAEVVLEFMFVVATWTALLLIGAVMACQRGGLPWVDPTDARTTSRSTGSRAHRALRR